MLDFFDTQNERDRYDDYYTVSNNNALLPFQVQSTSDTISSLSLENKDGVLVPLSLDMDSDTTVTGNHLHYYSGGLSSLDCGIFSVVIEFSEKTIYSEWVKIEEFAMQENTRDWRKLPLPLYFSEENVDKGTHVYTDLGQLPPFQHLEKKSFSGSATATLETELGEVAITEFDDIMEDDYVRFRSNGEAMPQIIKSGKYRVRIEDGSTTLYSNYFSV